MVRTWESLLALSPWMLGAVEVEWVAWRGFEELGPPNETLGWEYLPDSIHYERAPWERPSTYRLNSYRSHHPLATHYILGQGLVEVEVWQPYPDDKLDGSVSASFRGALFEVYRGSLDKVRVKLVNSDWETVGSARICQRGAPCPNLILLKDTQIPARMSNGNVHMLNSMLAGYMEGARHVLEADVPSALHDQYKFGGKWVGMPLAMDVLLLAYNSSSVKSLPEHWTWDAFADLACSITEQHAGMAGFRAFSGSNGDFQLAMVMAQSGGAQLLQNGTRKCGLRGSFIDDLRRWRRLVRGGCIAGVRSTYWRGVSPPSASFNAALVEHIDPSQPPELDELSEDGGTEAGARVQSLDDVGPGFFLSRGLGDVLPMGRCNRSSDEPVRCSTTSRTTIAPNIPECARWALQRGDNTLRYRDGTCYTALCSRATSFVDFPVDEWNVYSMWCSDIRYIAMPGKSTFLGSAGLIIPAYPDAEACMSQNFSGAEVLARDLEVPGACSQRDREHDRARTREGWRIMAELRKVSKPWLKTLNWFRHAISPAPIRTVDDLQLWGPFGHLKHVWGMSLLGELNRAYTSQFPSSDLPDMDEIFQSKPLRLTLLRAVYRDSPEQAAEDGCAVLEEVVRRCDREHWEIDERCVHVLNNKSGCRAGEFLPTEEDTPSVRACASCPAGRFQPQRSVDVECAPCALGRYAALSGATACEVCAEGTMADLPGSTSCSYCSAGHVVTSDHSRCTPCPARSYQDGFECQGCPLGQRSDIGSSGLEACELSAEYLALLSTFIVSSMLLTWLLHDIFCHAIMVRDVRLESGRLVVTTWSRHRVLKRRWGPVVVQVEGTNHPALDGCSFRACFDTDRSLCLLTDRGEVITTCADASTGIMRVTFPWSLTAAGHCCCPCGLLLSFVSILWSSAVAAFTTNPDWVVAEILIFFISGGVAAAFVIVGLLLRRFHLSYTLPLHHRCREFKSKLQRENPQPQACERGPGRAVSMSHLEDLYETFEHFIQDRGMYYVASNIVAPLTSEQKLSYAELVGPRRVQWFVSHFWGDSFRDFVASLRRLAQRTARWEDVAFWVCTFSNNQWAVQTELGSGDAYDSSFYLALESPDCHGTAMVIDENAWPLKRSWCLFEVLQTCLLAAKRADFAGLLFCTPKGVLQYGGTGVDCAIAIATRLSTLRLQDASATSLDDKRMIDGCVEAMEGGFGAMNRFVRMCMRDALHQVNQVAEADFSKLMQALDDVPGENLASDSE